jgi:uncharacterized membrane protein YphA (DoxX/SURF4 family)
MPSFKKDPVFWARLVLGGIFIWAGADKILHPAAFAQAIYNYQILPTEMINLTALILPWVEVLLGTFLVLGVWLPGSVAVANVLLLVFLGALVFNVARGLDIHCGCFSSSTEGDPATLWYLLRDMVFLSLGGYLFLKVFLRRAVIRDSAAP